MTLLLVGFTGFVLGVAAIIFGRSLHAREVAGRRGGVDDVLEKFLDWYLHKAGPLVADPDGGQPTTGERVAEAGSIIAGLGVVAMVAGVVRLALA